MQEKLSVLTKFAFIQALPREHTLWSYKLKYQQYTTLLFNFYDCVRNVLIWQYNENASC